MPIELTDEDRAAIAAALVPFQTNSGSRQEEMIDAIYRAGLAAGIERSAKVCEHNASLYPRFGTGEESSLECAAAIRALLKPTS